MSNFQLDESGNLVGHGDELAYLFDAQDMEGNPLPVETPTEDDLKVRSVFTKMIADFARHGEIRVDNQKVPSFNAGDNNFVQVKPKPVVQSKFKFCEMALWTHIGERLKSGYCQFLNALQASGVPTLSPVKNLEDLIGGMHASASNTRNTGLGLLSSRQQGASKKIGGILG